MPQDKFFMFRQQNSNLNEKYKLKTKKLAATVKNLVFVSILNHKIFDFFLIKNILETRKMQRCVIKWHRFKKTFYVLKKKEDFF